MIFAKPSGAQTKTTNRSFEKSTKIGLMEEKKILTEEKKSNTTNGHETPFLMSK